ncbi:MAG: toll/interleukin-1 receptor domain-containing protein [Promethearchaeota archaeon]
MRIKMKHIFISYSRKDKVIANLMYQSLIRRYWSDVDIFMDVFSIRPSENWDKRIKDEANHADLGIVVWSEFASKSKEVEREIKTMSDRGISMIYIALHEKWQVSYEKNIQSFPLYDKESPIVGVEEICNRVAEIMNISEDIEFASERRLFEDRHVKGKDSASFNQRDAYIVVHAIKCAEEKVQIMGENALQPIHGGFEHLQRLLKKGGTVQVLILDYNSSIFSEREKREEARQSGRVRADWIASVGNLIELERMRSGQGTLNVKCYSQEPKSSLIIVDDWLIQSNPYEPAGAGGKRGFGHEMHIWLNRGPSEETFAVYQRMFNRIWNDTSTRDLDLKSINIRDSLPNQI